MNVEAIRTYLIAEFPQVFDDLDLVVERAEKGDAALLLTPEPRHLRPGGIVSGPTLMMLVDAAAYAALLSLSDAAKMAVTTSLNINFLRAGAPRGAIRQTATVIKPGRRLMVLTGNAYDADGAHLTHTSLTYAMPNG
ncbi:MAG: PaaI family thioesterase [Pseudomonadota bacterium]